MNISAHRLTELSQERLYYNVGLNAYLMQLIDQHPELQNIYYNYIQFNHDKNSEFLSLTESEVNILLQCLQVPRIKNLFYQLCCSNDHSIKLFCSKMSQAHLDSLSHNNFYYQQFCRSIFSPTKYFDNNSLFQSYNLNTMQLQQAQNNQPWDPLMNQSVPMNYVHQVNVYNQVLDSNDVYHPESYNQAPCYDSYNSVHYNMNGVPVMRDDSYNPYQRDVNNCSTFSQNRLLQQQNGQDMFVFHRNAQSKMAMNNLKSPLK